MDVDDVTRFEYDAQANLSRVINFLGHIVSFDNYDAHGRAQSVTGANGVSYSLNYNTLGQLTSSTGPDGTTLYFYDQLGLLVYISLTNNSTFTYHYDALNRLSSITVDSQPNANMIFRYDDPEALYGVGQLTSITDASGVSKCSYTVSGELTSQELIVDGRTLLTNYTYDRAGQLASIEYPSGCKAVYQRNVAGEVIELH